LHKSELRTFLLLEKYEKLNVKFKKI